MPASLKKNCPQQLNGHLQKEGSLRKAPSDAPNEEMNNETLQGFTES